jgi:inorganic phosphate transporter, PiT family
MTLVLTVIFVALVFEYINGFHDTANSIATVVSTKVLTPRQAILLAATTNLAGALMGHAVAKTVSSGLVDGAFVTNYTIICALLGGIAWNLITWMLGLPSSSTHALVGGLCGATLASAHNNWKAILWSFDKVDKVTGEITHAGVLHKVVVPMIASPLIGFVAGFVVMALLYVLLKNQRPGWVNARFGKLQLASAGYMGWAHGFADAQKTMGIITLSLVTATAAGSFDALPSWLGFLRLHNDAAGVAPEVPAWIKVVCALTMAAGTAGGGWRIIRTMGHKMVKLQPVHGFAAETVAATLLAVTGKMGMTVSTTHAITTSIMGVGAAKRFSAVKLGVVERIVWAWVLTLPAAGVVGYGLMCLTQAFGWTE